MVTQWQVPIPDQKDDLMGRKAVGGPDELARALSRAIDEELRARHMSRRTLATEIGMSERYLRVRLNDETPLSVNDLARISAVFGIEITEFLEQLRDEWTQTRTSIQFGLAASEGRAIQEEQEDLEAST